MGKLKSSDTLIWLIIQDRVEAKKEGRNKPLQSRGNYQHSTESL